MKIKNIIFISLLVAGAPLHAGLLHDAVQANDYWRAWALIALGWDVNGKDGNGKRPLHFVGGFGGDIEMGRLLLDSGALVDARGIAGTTPLHRVSDIGIAQLLLDAGASIDARDKDGGTPLHWAVHYGGDIEMVRFLLDSGALVGAKNYSGVTSLHEAVYRGQAEIAQLLLDRGASTHAIANDGRPAFRDWTPLHQAAHNDKREVAQLLVYHAALQRKKAELLEVKDEDGQTAADIARARGHQEIYELLTDEAKRNKLIGDELRKRNNVSAFLRARALGLNPQLR